MGLWEVPSSSPNVYKKQEGQKHYKKKIFSYLYQSFYFSQCLKFKTDQAQDAKKMEKLNNIFFTLMARGPEGHFPFLYFYYSIINTEWI